MAEALSAISPSGELAAQEATRLELARSRREGSALDRASERWGTAGVTNGGAPSVDQAIAKESREQRLGSMLRTARSPSRRQQEPEQGRQGGGGGGLSFGQIAGAIGGGKTSALSGAAGSGSAAGGIKQMKQQVGAAIIKACWTNLLDSFGHTIWIIDLMFILGWASSFLREYIPEVGMEWIPQNLRNVLPRSAILPVKLGEIVVMIFISFFIGIIDILILSMIILIISVLMAVGAGIAH